MTDHAVGDGTPGPAPEVAPSEELLGAATEAVAAWKTGDPSRGRTQRMAFAILALDAALRAELGRAGTAQPTDVERKQMAVMLYAEYARIPSPNFFGLPKAEIELWLDVADVAFALGAERREPAP